MKQPTPLRTNPIPWPMLSLIAGGLLGLMTWASQQTRLTPSGRTLTQVLLALALALLGAGAVGLLVGRLRRGRGLTAGERAGAMRQAVGIGGLLLVGLAAAVWPTSGLWSWLATLATLACGLGALWLGLRLAQNGTPAELRQARHAYRLGELDEATRLVEAALRARPNEESALQLAVQVARQRGDHAAALRSAQALTEARPDGYFGHAELGLTLLAQGQPRRAIAPLARAAEIAPNLAEAHFNLGMAQAEAGQSEPASVALSRALRLGLPDEVARLIARYHLYAALGASGQSERAAAELRHLRRQAGTLKRWRDSLAESHITPAERQREAVLQQRIEKAIKLSTS